MSSSIKSVIPQIVISLLNEHSSEWNVVESGQISYQLKRGQGYFVIFRTRSLGRKRLISAHIPTRLPKSETEWKSLRGRITRRATTNLSDAKYRYLFVPSDFVTKAVSAFSDTKVKVKSIP